MANTTAVLQHSAEEIDSKLNLIDENKNILKYPYTYGSGITSSSILETYKLIDVEDGSFLTQGNVIEGNTGPIFLNECLLAPGKAHIISLSCTDIFEATVTEDTCRFKLTIELFDEEETRINLETLNLSETVTVGSSTLINPLDYSAILKVYLEIPNSFNAEWLIKPQVEVVPVNEKGELSQTTATSWVPHMDKIGTYVDRRFNNTNKKFKSLASKVETLNGLTAEDVAKMRMLVACFDIELKPE